MAGAGAGHRRRGAGIGRRCGIVEERLPPPTAVAGRLLTLLDTTDLPPLFAGLEPSPAPPVDLPGRDGGPRAGRLGAGKHGPRHQRRVRGGHRRRQRVLRLRDARGHQRARRRRWIGDDRHDLGRGARGGRRCLRPGRRPGAASRPHRAGSRPPAERRGTAARRNGRHAGVSGGWRHDDHGRRRHGFLRDRRARTSTADGINERSVVEMRTQIRRGNSGGPLVVAPGTVGAVVFGGSQRRRRCRLRHRRGPGGGEHRAVHRFDGGRRYRRLPVGLAAPMPWTRHAKIAFIGSHSVRKSNAVHAFASTVGRAGRSVEVGREVVRFNPLGLNEGATSGGAAVGAGGPGAAGARACPSRRGARHRSLGGRQLRLLPPRHRR